MTGGTGAGEAEAREFLRALAAAVRAFGLYPAGHPMREETLGQMLTAAREILAVQGSFDYFVHEDSFFFGRKYLPKESLTFHWLMRDWQQLRIRSVTVASGVTREDLAALIDFLTGLGPEPTQGATVNTAALLDPSELETPEAANRLRRAYMGALDLLREIGMGVARGGAPPLAAAQESVESLVGEVLADPDSALLLATIHSHSEYTFFHMVNVCILSVATGTAIGLERPQLTALGLGALLHDMGKVAVPAHLLHRAGPLSDEEWREIRRHPTVGASVILRSWERITPLAARIAYEHHQHMDGSGYPGLAMDPRAGLLSRIVSVADAYDALTSRRAYRRAEQRGRALEILMAGAGPHFDPRLVKVFIRMLGFYPPGAVVQLDDGSIGAVVRNNPGALDRPVIRVVRAASGEQVPPVDLDLDSPDGRDRTMVRALDPREAGIDPADLV